MRKETRPVVSQDRAMAGSTVANSLARKIGEEFPRIGGLRIHQLCAELIIEEVQRCHVPRARLLHGQIVWLAISEDDPPSRGKRTAGTRMVAVVLDAFIPEDAEDVMNQVPAKVRLAKRAGRMCRQAYAQGGLLSNVDLSMIMSMGPSRIGHALAAYERDNEVVVPRRATLHDMGAGMTHKAVICRKRYRDGKTPNVIARETYHSISAVDRYLGQYVRVRHCRQQGMDRQSIAFTLNCSQRLVQQYLDIDDELPQPAAGETGSDLDAERSDHRSAPPRAAGEDSTRRVALAPVMTNPGRSTP